MSKHLDKILVFIKFFFEVWTSLSLSNPSKSQISWICEGRCGVKCEHYEIGEDPKPGIKEPPPGVGVKFEINIVPEDLILNR